MLVIRSLVGKFVVFVVFDGREVVKDLIFIEEIVFEGSFLKILVWF